MSSRGLTAGSKKLKTMKEYYVYILTNKYNRTLYIGVTSNLIKRIWEHRNNIFQSFSSKYNVNKLVYFEQYNEVIQAIQREKRLKEWQRQWKIDLINNINPKWNDLYGEIV